MSQFHSPDLLSGRLPLALARRPPNTYLLRFASGASMAPSPIFTVLNSSTPASESPVLSSSGCPCVWIDADIEHDANYGPDMLGEDGMAAALLKAQPPVVRRTGRTRLMRAPGSGGRSGRVVEEVEILLGEDELWRVCCFCGTIEKNGDVDEERHRMKRCGGEGYTSVYRCWECSEKTLLGRTAASAWKGFGRLLGHE